MVRHDLYRRINTLEQRIFKRVPSASPASTSKKLLATAEAARASREEDGLNNQSLRFAAIPCRGVFPPFSRVFLTHPFTSSRGDPDDLAGKPRTKTDRYFAQVSRKEDRNKYRQGKSGIIRRIRKEKKG